MLKQKGDIVAAAFISGLLLVLIGYCCFYPIVFHTGRALHTHIPVEPEAGAQIDVLAPFDFDKDEWVAYLVLDHSDNSKEERLLPGTLYKTTDRRLLQQMQQDWVFPYTGGDMTTVQSSILLYRNDTLVFESNIVLDKQLQGLQSNSFGWMPDKTGYVLNNYCHRFEAVHYPLVFLY